MFCSQCGKDIPEDSEFCRFCGKPNITAGAQPQGPPPGPPPGAFTPAGPAPTAPMPVMSPGMGGPVKPKRKWVLPLVILGALIVAAGVTLGLVFGLKGTTPTSGGPEATANKFFAAVGDGDVDAIIATFDRGLVKDLKDTYGSDYKQAVDDFFFAATSDAKFSGLKFQTTVTGDEATVTVVEGTVTYRDEDGKKVTEPVTEADEVFLDLVKSGNDWFIDGSSFADILYQSTSNSSDTNTTVGPVTPPVIPPDYTPNPEPYATATQCYNCGGYGVVACSVCGGEGGYNTEVQSVCPTCGGTTDCYNCGGWGYFEDGWPCEVCGGTGYCPTCGDSGVINEMIWNSCYGCGGSGYTTCPVCLGAGWL